VSQVFPTSRFLFQCLRIAENRSMVYSCCLLEVLWLLGRLTIAEKYAIIIIM